MNAMPFLSFYTVCAWATGLLPAAIFLFAIINYSRSPKAAMLVMVGSAMMLLSFVGSVGFSVFGSAHLSSATFGRFAMLVNSITSIGNAAGIVLVASAAFSGRTDSSIQQVKFEGRTAADTSNPYRSSVH